MTKERAESLQPYQQDEIMREVRANREAYVARFNHDVHAMFERMREVAAEEGLRGEKREPRRVDLEQSA